jgi:hypothetical protein
MLGNYKLVNIENGPITTIGTGLYVFNIAGAAYLDIKNPENPINVIGSMYVPENSYKKIIDDLSKYNRELYNSDGLYGSVIDISYRGHQDSQLKEHIKGKLVEILSEYNLDNKIEMITNNGILHRLINYKKYVRITVKISIF